MRISKKYNALWLKSKVIASRVDAYGSRPSDGPQRVMISLELARLSVLNILRTNGNDDKQVDSGARSVSQALVEGY